MQQFKYYCIGFFLGIVLSIATFYYFKFIFVIKNKGLRIIWGLIQAGSVLFTVYLSKYILKIEFPEIQTQDERSNFLLLWIVPSFLTFLYSIWRDLKNRLIK